MTTEKGLAKSLFKIAGILILIQLARIIINAVVFAFVKHNFLTDDIMKMVSFSIIAIPLFIMFKPNLDKLSLNFGKGKKSAFLLYIIFSAAILICLAVTPIFNGGYTAGVIVMLIANAVFVPVFEELIFRGYIWNRLNRFFKDEFFAYAITTVLFALWHLGYFDTVFYRSSALGMHPNMAVALSMKALAGLCFGVIVGFVRLRTKNTYAGILTHIFMNIIFI